MVLGPIMQPNKMKELVIKAIKGDKEAISFLKQKDELYLGSNVHYAGQMGIKEVLKLPDSLKHLKNEKGETPVHYLAYNLNELDFKKMSKSDKSVRDDFGYSPYHWVALNFYPKAKWLENVPDIHSYLDNEGEDPWQMHKGSTYEKFDSPFYKVISDSMYESGTFKYAKLFPYKFQNEFLLKCLCNINSQVLDLVLKNIDAASLRKLLIKYPAYKNRLPKRLKEVVFPSFIKRAIIPLVMFGLLSKEEQVKFYEKMRHNLPWNKNNPVINPLFVPNKIKERGIGRFSNDEMKEFERKRKANLPWNKKLKLEGSTQKKYSYKGKIVIASSKIEAIKKIKLSKLDKDYIFKKAMDGDKSILKLPKESWMIKDEWGNTPIHWLARKKVRDILKLPKELLIIKNKYGRTPVHMLADRGVKEILKLPKEILLIKNEIGNNSIHKLTEWYVKEILDLPRELLSVKNTYGNTPVRILYNKGVTIPEKLKDLI